MKIFKRILVILGIILAALVLFVGIFIIYANVTTLNPKDIENMEILGESSKELNNSDSFKIMTWNTGYGGLGDDQDFFMDGGKNVNPNDKKRVESNLQFMVDKVNENNPDILFLQELDYNSKRSFRIDEREVYTKGLINDKYMSSFALNFKAGYVPYPVFNSIGKVNAGISTYSKYKLETSERIQLPVPFSWPLSMFNLKRCLLVNKIKIKNTDKYLVVVNLHLEAYDSGEGKIAQTKKLKELLDKEVAAGNYVIAGGDFNQSFSNVDQKNYTKENSAWKPGIIEASDFENYNMMMDNTSPTCRSLEFPYVGADKSKFTYYLIDGFIVSKNIDVLSIKTIDYDFSSTDHNPVLMNVKLK